MTTRRKPGLDEVLTDEALDEFALFSPEVVEPPDRRVPVGVSLLVVGVAAGLVVGLAVGRVLPAPVLVVSMVVCAAVAAGVAVVEIKGGRRVEPS